MSILVVFTAKLKEGAEERYAALSRMMLELALKQPGLIFLNRGRSVTEERGIISVSQWESEEALQAWRNHPVHQEAQKKAIEELFESYALKKARLE